MKHLSRAVLVAFSLLIGAGSAAAQQPLRLEIRAGLVNLHAQNVPLRQILTEWARVGGTRFVNIERVTGAPVTLDLTGVSERQALDTLLRNVAGYLLGSRQPSGPGASAFDRVVILASSTAPRVAPTPQGFANGPATRVPQPQFDPADPEENPSGDVAPQPVRSPVFPAGVPRPGVPNTEPTQPDPPDQGDTPGVVIISPSNPFGVPTGSGAPGSVTPVQPPPVNPNQPRIQDPD